MITYEFSLEERIIILKKYLINIHKILHFENRLPIEYFTEEEVYFLVLSINVENIIIEEKINNLKKYLKNDRLPSEFFMIEDIYFLINVIHTMNKSNFREIIEKKLLRLQKLKLVR